MSAITLPHGEGCVWKYKCDCTFDPHFICTRILLLSPSLLHSPPLSSSLLCFPPTCLPLP